MTWGELKAGAEFSGPIFGPFTLVDMVRWAGVQENDELVHFDRDFARHQGGLKGIIVSGGHRQALLARTLTDLAGPQGRLLRMRVRHTAPTFEGDTLCYSARLKDAIPRAGGTEVTCDIEGKNQRDEQVLVGSCGLFVATSAPTRG